MNAEGSSRKLLMIWRDASSQATDDAVTRMLCYLKHGRHMLMYRLLLQAQTTAAYLELT